MVKICFSGHRVISRGRGHAPDATENHDQIHSDTQDLGTAIRLHSSRWHILISLRNPTSPRPPLGLPVPGLAQEGRERLPGGRPAPGSQAEQVDGHIDAGWARLVGGGQGNSSAKTSGWRSNGP